MSQIILGVGAGLLGGLAVLVLGLGRKRKNNVLMEEQTSQTSWGRTVMIVLFLTTGILPLIGLIAGILGVIKKEKRLQGLALLFYAIGAWIMFVMVKITCGIIFNMTLAIFFSIFLKKYEKKRVFRAFIILVISGVLFSMFINSVWFYNNIFRPLGLK